jgi:hypothetical protein
MHGMSSVSLRTCRPIPLTRDSTTSASCIVESRCTSNDPTRRVGWWSTYKAATSITALLVTTPHVTANVKKSADRDMLWSRDNLLTMSAGQISFASPFALGRLSGHNHLDSNIQTSILQPTTKKAGTTRSLRCIPYGGIIGFRRLVRESFLSYTRTTSVDRQQLGRFKLPFNFPPSGSVVDWRSEHQNTFPKGINTILSPHKSTFEALLMCIRHGLGLTLDTWEQARATLPATVKGPPHSRQPL